MKHLIFGNGHMGNIYGDILTHLGEKVEYEDINRSKHTKTHHSLEYDSYFICTPPETHLGILNKLADLTRPIFIEKPIFPRSYDKNLLQSILERNRGITMVSCNWRFCTCISLKRDSRIASFYTSRDKEWEMDTIHFYDLYIESFGVPKKEFVHFYSRHGNNEVYIALDDFRADICTNSARTRTIFNSRIIHCPGITCNMFLLQAKYWLDCIKNNINSNNSIVKASSRTKDLISCIDEFDVKYEKVKNCYD